MGALVGRGWWWLERLEEGFLGASHILAPDGNRACPCWLYKKPLSQTAMLSVLFWMHVIFYKEKSEKMTTASVKVCVFLDLGHLCLMQVSGCPPMAGTLAISLCALHISYSASSQPHPPPALSQR